jgi:hypothetical protein
MELSEVINPEALKMNRLIHLTDLDTAIKISTSKRIFSRDGIQRQGAVMPPTGGRANFTVGVIENRALAATHGKKPEAKLVFEFVGTHYWTSDIDFIGSNVPPDRDFGEEYSDGNNIFHLFSTAKNFIETNNVPQLGTQYWQSMIFPGSSGLKLIDVELLEYPEGISQELTSRFNQSTWEFGSAFVVPSYEEIFKFWNKY